MSVSVGILMEFSKILAKITQKRTQQKKRQQRTIDINANIPLQSIFLNHYKFSL